jgi:murein DD-endopeptidase MepM/ murein hydrolase activator NlpD
VITSYFGPSHPLGIDIGVQQGTPIVAAKAGVVTFAGGDPCCSYGYYVDVDHGGGWMTRYGHFRSWPIVSVGQHVAQGQVLGYSGTTGYSTGPHLHFEIRLNGQVLNPLSFLP